MSLRTLLAGGLLALAAATPSTLGQETRYFEKDGVTYRELRQVVRRPVNETRYEERQQTVWRPQVVTEVQQMQWEPRWHGVLNPFKSPHVAYHAVPRTTWQPSVETVQSPVTKSEWVAETRTVRVPVTELRFAEEERITRVPMAPTPGTLSRAPRGGASVAGNPPIGGLRQLDGDPPRHGIAPPASILRR
jgi:hypothetical protein